MVLMKSTFSRRIFLGSSLSLGACKLLPERKPVPAKYGKGLPVRGMTDTPMGCCITTKQIDDKIFARQFISNFNQLTPEYEMKMGMMLRSNGALAFDASDRIAAFTKAHRIRLHGHALIWEQHQPPYFQGLDGRGHAFEEAYRHYIRSVVGRYKGRACGWDVVNEPLSHDGSALKPSLWGRNLGELDYIAVAFEVATEADPTVPMFLNEYGLERFPVKRRNYMRLIETLLKSGVKLSGIGTQTHVDIDVPLEEVRATIKDLASFGLPVHISELDISLAKSSTDMRTIEFRRLKQAEMLKTVAASFFALPEKQRYAFTLWGMRDSDSYMRRPPLNRKSDEPNLFDDTGQPKSLVQSLYEGIISSEKRSD